MPWDEKPRAAGVTVTRGLRLSEDHVNRFAEASGDRNPLHIDDAFARRTPFGRTIAHGALVTIAALGIADAADLRRAKTLDLQFKQPVLPAEGYTIAVRDADPQKLKIEVTGRGTLAAAIGVTLGPSGEEFADVRHEDPLLATSPRPYTLDELADGLSLTERYAPRTDDLSILAAEISAGHVPTAILVWLAAASYTVGMLIPGRDALFAGARISRASASDSKTLAASVRAADDRTGMVRVEATLEQAAASAALRLQTFVRTPVPAPTKASIGSYLEPSRKLSGRNVLVVGGSRGLGAAVCGGLATQGATVWSGFARSAECSESLRREFGADSIRPLRFDATDLVATAHAFETLGTHAGVLDAMVLCAAPPPYETTLHRDAVDPALSFLTRSVAMALTPLAEARRLLGPEFWLVVMSSSAVSDPPAGWPQYVMAKAALEAAAAYCARHIPSDVLIVQAPKTLTDSTNTPLGRLDATSAERVAAAIVRWTTGAHAAGALSVMGPDEILADAATAGAEST